MENSSRESSSTLNIIHRQIRISNIVVEVPYVFTYMLGLSSLSFFWKGTPKRLPFENREPLAGGLVSSPPNESTPMPRLSQTEHGRAKPRLLLPSVD